MSYIFDLSGNGIVRDTIYCDIIQNKQIKTSNNAARPPDISGNVYVNNLYVKNNFNIIPAGLIMPSISYLNHPGWLLCDGSFVSQNLYPNLSAAIGTQYGSSTINGIPHFRLPDYRGAFLVGLGGNDITNMNNPYGDTIATHAHSVNDPGHSHTTTDAQQGIDGWNNNTYLCGSATAPSHTWSGNFAASGGGLFGVTYDINKALKTSTTTPTINVLNVGNSETRPYNWGVNYYIKY